MWLVATVLPSTNPKLYFLILLQRTDGQGGLEWGRKESDTTDRLNWTERSFLGLSLLLHTQFRNGYANLDKIKAESWVTFLILNRQSHLFFFAFLISEYTSKGWEGKATGIRWHSVFIVQVCCITGRHTGNCKLDTNIKEMAALYHQKGSFILCFRGLSWWLRW